MDFLVFFEAKTILTQRDPAQERTLIATILPPKAAHIFTVLSTVFKKKSMLMDTLFLVCSLPLDFFVKSTGKVDLTNIGNLPVVDNDEIKAHGVLRALLLNCVNEYYSDLWKECWKEKFKKDDWTKKDSRLPNLLFKNLNSAWDQGFLIRTSYARRHALIEIDVLASMALNLTLSELITIYHIQFPVLQQNEVDTWYDQNGRIVFTCSKGLPGVGFTRSEWNEIKDMQSGTVSRISTDDTQPGGPVERTITYEAPFDRCDREKDYEVVWAEFERRFKV